MSPTGVEHSVRDLVDLAFEQVGLDPGRCVKIDPTLRRPADVDSLVADYAKAKRELGWEPRVGFGKVVRIMVEADLEQLQSGAPVRST